MKKLLILFFLFQACGIFAQDVIHLIPGNNLPTLTVFHPTKPFSKGTAVIICPGGAYAFRSDDPEGTQPAKLLNAAGITAFVLDYRLPAGNDTLPLHDAKTAITYIRTHAKTFQINPKRIGIMGFSAGGHLASTLGTHYSNPIERPDFMVLVYPVISMTDSLTHAWSRTELLGSKVTSGKIKQYSNELQVTDDTPGTFIVHAMDDPGVTVKNSLYFQAALLQHKVPVRLFLYAHGGHGFGIFNRTAVVQWTCACLDWIRQKKWKTNN